MEERDIFLEACEIADQDARNAYLDSACGQNVALRSRLQLLLEMHGNTGDFLKSPAIEQMIDAGPAAFHVESNDIDSQGLLNHEASEGTDSENSSPWTDLILSHLESSQEPGSLGRLANYEIVQILGRGGFGVVLKAFDKKLQRTVAIKVISLEFAATVLARNRFLREARASAAVCHENVVRVYTVDEEPIPFLVMEYVPGSTIQQRIDTHGPFTVLEVLKIGQQIASGLAAAHAVGLIHLDIKPANILLEHGVFDRVKITDFGLARILDVETLTQSGIMAGTPMYMSPEQVRGETLDQRTDLFSLGSVLYVMLTGHPPFHATTMVGTLKRVAEDQPPEIQESLVSQVPERLLQIIEKLHAKQPAERFASAKEVADALEKCLSDLENRRDAVLPGFKPGSQSSSWLQRTGPWVPAVAALLVVVSGWRFFTVSENAPQSRAKASRQVDLPLTLNAPIELGPLVRQTNIADGSFSDVSFKDGILTLDAWTHSRQLWIDFPQIEAGELNIETQLRVLNVTNFGFAKLVYMEHNGPQREALTIFGPEGYEVFLKYTQTSHPEAEGLQFPGSSLEDWIELKFHVTGEKCSIFINGKLMIEKPRTDSPGAGYVAIACGASRCELKNLRVTLNKF